MATALLVFLFAVSAVYATDHTVGDNAGWGTGVDYKSWATSKTFTVGDTLLFTYGGSHQVDMVSQDDYDNCATGNALESYTDGNSIITLNKTGPMYFLCPSFGHCGQGMKLAVTVSGASNTPGSTPPTTPAATTPAATTPSPTTPSTSPNSPTPTTPSTSPNSPTPTTPSTSPNSPTPTTPSVPSHSTPTLTTSSPPTTRSTSTPSGATNNFYNMNAMALGVSLMLAPVLAVMG